MIHFSRLKVIENNNIMTRYIYTLLAMFFCFSVVQLSAQVPGYLGKRGFVEYDIAFVFDSWGPTINGKDYSMFPELLSLNFKHKLTLNYVISRKRSIGVTIENFKAGYKSISIDDDYINLKGSSVGVEINNYYLSRGGLAPYGAFFLTSIKYITTKLDHPSLEDYNISNWYLGYGLGVRKVIFNRFVLNAKGKLGFLFGKQEYTDTSRITDGMYERIRRHFIFENSLGIGILLF